MSLENMIALSIPFRNRILVVRAGIRASRRFMTVRMSFLTYQLTFLSECDSDSNSWAGMNASEPYATVRHTYSKFGESSEVSVTVPSIPRVIFGLCVDRFADFCTKKGESKFGYQHLYRPTRENPKTPLMKSQKSFGDRSMHF